MKFVAFVLFSALFAGANAQLFKIPEDDIETALLTEYQTDSVFIWEEEVEWDIWEDELEIYDEDLMDDYWLFDEFIPEDRMKF